MTDKRPQEERAIADGASAGRDESGAFAVSAGPSEGLATDRLVLAMIGGVSTLAVYPPGHPQSEDAIGNVDRCVREAMRARQEDEISIAAIDQDIAVGGKPWKRTAPMRASLVRAFRRAGVDRLTLRQGCDEDEIRQLLLGLSARATLEESSHVGLGQIRLADEAAKSSSSEVDSLERRVDLVMSWLHAFARDSSAAFDELDKSLWELIEAAHHTDRNSLLNASLRTDEDRLFRHSIQVCLLATEIARTLGIRGAALQEISLGALLHDIGYLDLPRELVWRKRSLGLDEETLVQSHTELGAARLAAVEAVPPLCVITAYEHHLGYAGGGYPACLVAKDRRPHLAARITAVADHWHALENAGHQLPPAERRELATRGLIAEAGARLDPEIVRLVVESHSVHQSSVDGSVDRSGDHSTDHTGDRDSQ